MGCFQNIINKKYGKLRVIGISDKRDKYDNIHWYCLCDCGNKYTARGSSLKNGHTTSCGCAKTKSAIDETGNVYGLLTVLEKTKGRQCSSIFLDCVCTCGNRLPVRRDLLLLGKKTYCEDESRHQQLTCCYIEEATKVYGKLTVLQIRPERGTSGTVT